MIRMAVSKSGHTKPYSIKFSEEEIESLKDEAERRGTTMTAIIREKVFKGVNFDDGSSAYSTKQH